jgi:LysR family hydrogen peroxide-inducible transcriptional activator
VVVREIDHLIELTKEMKGEIKGDLSISVIPTIAPYLLPLFLQRFASQFEHLNIKVKEQTTSEIIRQIKSRELDMGIISIPVNEKDLVEVKLYDEPFVFYDADIESHEKVSVEGLNLNNLCLLEEGHCMRTQVLKLCDAHKKRLSSKLNFEYEAGSIDSLLRFVRANGASTLLPLLSTLDLPESEHRHISPFAAPIPFRTVGIVVHKHFVKKRLLKLLQANLLENVGAVLKNTELEGEQLLPV